MRRDCWEDDDGSDQSTLGDQKWVRVEIEIQNKNSSPKEDDNRGFDERVAGNHQW